MADQLDKIIYKLDKCHEDALKLADRYREAMREAQAYSGGSRALSAALNASHSYMVNLIRTHQPAGLSALVKAGEKISNLLPSKKIKNS